MEGLKGCPMCKERPGRHMTCAFSGPKASGKRGDQAISALSKSGRAARSRGSAGVRGSASRLVLRPPSPGPGLGGGPKDLCLPAVLLAPWVKTRVDSSEPPAPGPVPGPKAPQKLSQCLGPQGLWGLCGLAAALSVLARPAAAIIAITAYYY